jgi:hypothetical protein
MSVRKRHRHPQRRTFSAVALSVLVFQAAGDVGCYWFAGRPEVLAPTSLESCNESQAVRRFDVGLGIAWGLATVANTVILGTILTDINIDPANTAGLIFTMAAAPGTFTMLHGFSAADAVAAENRCIDVWNRKQAEPQPPFPHLPTDPPHTPPAPPDENRQAPQPYAPSIPYAP